jgi:hypothetical protein
MAAPTPTPRTTPSGLKLKDGYRALVTFATDANFEVWEKQVTPPGMDGGEPIEQTTMWNDNYRTFAPRALITMTPHTFTGAYDPAFYSAAAALINVETTVTVTFKDGSTLAFYGFLQKFDPQALVEGQQPEATFTIVPTNTDPSDGTEAGPVLTSVAGT